MDFIWFVKKAVTDKKSYSHAEMYHSLLKLFVDADTNKDGLVSKASFSSLIDQAAAMPRAYGYAPSDTDMWKNQQEKDAARQKMFDSMDLKATGVITFDEWLKFCQDHILAKTATMTPHPMIDGECVPVQGICQGRPGQGGGTPTRGALLVHAGDLHR